MNILLTGATGTLGSRVLFSLMEQRFNSLNTIYLPVRKKSHQTPKTRILNIVNSEFATDFIKENLAAVVKKIKVVDAEQLLDPDSFLGNHKLDYFIHSAGFVNLSTHPEAEQEVFSQNLQFTKNIFNSYSNYIGKFVYISTAFASGNVGGLIGDDYSLLDNRDYRNHYEASKHAAEKFLIKTGKEKNIPVQILRPSVLGGNINEPPNYFISKYMVFYLFAKFFHNHNSKDSIRLTIEQSAGLNIIPTDYVAQVIAKVISHDIGQLNIVNSTETNMIKGISRILDVVGFSNFSFTEDPINTTTGFASKTEEFYYQTIGMHLLPYMTSKPNKWDTRLPESILPIPSYNLEDYLSKTVAFAMLHNFRNQKW